MNDTADITSLNGSATTNHDASNPAVQPREQTLRAADLAVPATAAHVPMVLRASDLANDASSGAASVMSSRRISVGETALVRPVSDQFVVVPIHWLQIGAGNDKYSQMVPCNPTWCVLCATKNQAKEQLFIPFYFLNDGAIGVISFARSGGAGSLLGQLVPLLKRDDCTDLIIQITRPSKVRYAVKINQHLGSGSAPGGIDYGDDVLADIVAGGGISAADVRATVANVGNEELLETNPNLATLLAAYGGGASPLAGKAQE